MASDTMPGMEDSPATTYGEPQRRQRGRAAGYWDELAEGGHVTMPLEKQMWGDESGMSPTGSASPWMVNIGTGGGAG